MRWVGRSNWIKLFGAGAAKLPLCLSCAVRLRSPPAGVPSSLPSIRWRLAHAKVDGSQASARFGLVAILSATSKFTYLHLKKKQSKLSNCCRNALLDRLCLAAALCCSSMVLNDAWDDVQWNELFLHNFVYHLSTKIEWVVSTSYLVPVCRHCYYHVLGLNCLVLPLFKYNLFLLSTYLFL